MNGRTLILMVVAIMVAVVTAIVIKNRTSGGDTGPKVLVAATDIEAGQFIHADKDIIWTDWPQGSLSPAFITPDAHQITEFNGAVAREGISAGVPITAGSIIRSNEGGFMSAVLTPGMRAVSIAVSLTTGNAGFVFPGDKVDLLLTHKIVGKDNTENVLASETFIENVRVLAIDQMLENPENKAVVAKTITLEVTPKQAEMINVATSLGSISVSLRSLSATIKAGTDPVIAKTLPPAKTPATPDNAAAIAPAPAEAPVNPVPPSAGPNYSTDNDVSKLMGDKNAVRAKVSVYHGNTAEQLDFHQQGGR